MAHNAAAIALSKSQATRLSALRCRHSETIDNDVAFVSRTFGYVTAVNEAAKAISCAHTEAHSVQNGISVVKIMERVRGFYRRWRYSGQPGRQFHARSRSAFCTRRRTGVSRSAKQRILKRGHAVILVCRGRWTTSV